jgi:putative MATE family efflux protein
LLKEDSIKVQNSYANIVKLALPIAVSILIPQISMLTNTYFLGNYTPTLGLYQKQDLLSASGIAGIFYLTLVMVGYGLVSGLLMLMSRKAGENDKVGLGKLMSNGIILCFSLAILTSISTYYLAPLLFDLSIHEESIRISAIQFIHIRTWGLPFIILAQLGNTFFLATSNSKYIIAGSAVQTLFNIIFDYLLIFGNLGFTEMGLAGSALASVIADIGFMASVWLIIKFKDYLKIYSIHIRKNWNWSLSKQILYKSLPLIIQYFLSIGAWELFFIFVEHLGKAESALSQILRSVFGIVGVATWALGSTCNSMVSNVIGQQKMNEVIPLIQRVVIVSFFVSLSIGLPLLLFPNYFLNLLTNDASLVEMGTSSLRIVVVATWMLSVASIYFNGVVGTGNTSVNMIFEFVAIVLYCIYITIVIEYLQLPLPFAWASEFVYWLSLFVMSAYYLHKGNWKKYNSSIVTS